MFYRRSTDANCQTRIASSGLFWLPAIDIAEAYIRAVYLGIDANETFFGLSEAQFTQALHSNSIVWAPDGDEAFDDGSYVLQFDIDNQVRVIAFQCPDALPDPSSVREVWLHSETFYAILGEWNEAFIAEWKSLPKHD